LIFLDDIFIDDLIDDYIFNYYDFSLNFVNLIFNINPESFLYSFWDIIFDKNITTKNLEIKKKIYLIIFWGI
jgi:hypothetical protein